MVLYKTHWAGLSEPSWEQEMDFHLSPHLALLGRNPGPAPPNQPPVPPNADRGGTPRALPQQRGTFPSAGLRLCSPRRLAPSLPRHRYSLRKPTFSTRETMGYGGLEKSARALPRTRYTWFASWTTRDQLNFLFPRRATRLQREPYDVLVLASSHRQCVSSGNPT